MALEFVYDPMLGRYKLTETSGYVRLYEDEPSRANYLRYQYEHRKVMEDKLQRKLLAKEIIHHLDGDKSNNSPENLELITDHTSHVIGSHRGEGGRWATHAKMRMLKEKVDKEIDGGA